MQAESTFSAQPVTPLAGDGPREEDLPVSGPRRVERARGPAQLMGLQVLRGMAALAVIVHHALEESQPLFGNALPRPLVLAGAAGVDLFFVISGFIMLHTSWTEFGRSGAVRRFLSRRALRIYPLYLACLALVLLGWSSGVFYRSLQITPANLVASTLLLPSRSLIVGVSWTLVFEMYFYAAFAAWLFLKRPGRVVLALPLTLALLALVAQALPFAALRLYWGNPIIYEFVLGLLIALSFRSGWRLPVANGWALLAVVAIVFASVRVPSVTTAGLEPMARVLCWGIPAALLVCSQLGPKAGHGRFGARLARLGDASYALYLAHGFVLIVFAWLVKRGRLSHSVPSWGWLGLVILACIAFGVAVHHAVERPLTRALQSLANRGRSAQAERRASTRTVA